MTNYITVPKGTTVRYTVSKDGYQTETGTLVVNSTQILDVVLQSQGREIDVSDYEYTLTDGVVTLNKFIGSGTDVTIPNV